jgi:hypothetical protein
MPVSLDELTNIAQSYQAQGMQGDELVAALKNYKDTANTAGADSGPPLTLKSLAVGGTETLSDMLGGVGMSDAASAVQKWINPLWQQEVHKAEAGPLSDIDTWTSNIAANLPMTLGALGLGRLGLGVAGAVGEYGLPGAAFVAQQRGSTLSIMKDYGIDPDIADRRATSAGFLNGALSEAELAQKFIPFKVMPGLVSQKIASSPILARMAQELGINSLMGIEQGGMAGVTGYATQAAIQDMKQRHGDSWEPPQGYQAPDISRAVGLGVGVGMATRAATTVTMAPFVKYQERQARIKLEGEAGGADLAAADAGGLNIIPPDVQINVRPNQEALDLARDQIAAPENEGKVRVGSTFEDLTPVRQAAAIDSVQDTVEGHAKMLAVVNGIRKQLGAEPMPDTTPLPTLQAYAKANYDLVPEGPSWSGAGDDKTVVMKPVLGGGIIPDEDITWGVNAGHYVDNPLSKLTDPMQLADTQSMVKNNALLAAGLDSELAQRPELIQPGVPVEQWMQGMSDKLTRGQFTRAAQELYYQGDWFANAMSMKSALANKNPLMYADGVGQPKVFASDGTDLTAPTPENLGASSMGLAAAGLRPYASVMDQVSRATGLPLKQMDASVQVLLNHENAWEATFHNMMAHTMGRFPKVLGRGVQYQDLTRMVYFAHMSPETQELLAHQEQFGLSDVAPKDRLAVLGSRVLERGRIKDISVQQLLDMVEKAKPDFKTMTDWLGRVAGVPLERMIKYYLPMYHEYFTSPEWDARPLGDFIESKRDWFKRMDLVRDMDRVVDLGDTAKALMRKGATNLGQGTASYEFQRASNREWMKQMYTETDPVKLLSLYANRAIKKAIFEGAAPSIEACMNNAVASVAAGGRPGITEAVKKIGQDYLNSCMGVPETGIIVSRKLNLRDQDTFIGRLIDNHFNRLQKWFGHLHDFSGPVTPHDIVQDVMGFMYPMTLGIPMNMKAPLENILNQTPMAMAFGTGNFVHGLGELYSAKSNAVREELLKMDLHGMAHDIDRTHIMSKDSMMDIMNKTTMSYFIKSDIEQRLVSGATARYAWNKLQPLLDADPTFKNVSKEQMSKVIWGGKTPSQLGIDLNQIATQGENLRTMDMFKNGAPRGFRGIEDAIYSHIINGKAPIAKEMLIRYAADLAGFRYGPGGTPKLLGGVLKPLLMFTSYPINYIEWNAMMLHPKNQLIRNWTSTFMVQSLAAALASTMGIATADRWLLTGPLPKEFGLQGPITQLLNSMLGSITGAANTATANVLPGVSDEERQRVHNNMMKSLNELGQRSYMLIDALI